MERESFIFYKSFFDAIALLEKKDEIADIFLAILGYAFSGKEPDLKGHLKSIFLVVKPQIDANNKRYEFGQLGGRPKKPMVSKSCTNQKPMVFKNCANQKPMVFKSCANQKPMVFKGEIFEWKESLLFFTKVSLMRLLF